MSLNIEDVEFRIISILNIEDEFKSNINKICL